MHLLKFVVNNLTYYSSNITQEVERKCFPRSIALLNGRIEWIVHQAGFFPHVNDPLGKVCERTPLVC